MKTLIKLFSVLFTTGLLITACEGPMVRPVLRGLMELMQMRPALNAIIQLELILSKISLHMQNTHTAMQILRKSEVQAVLPAMNQKHLNMLSQTMFLQSSQSFLRQQRIQILMQHLQAHRTDHCSAIRAMSIYIQPTLLLILCL